MEYQWYKNEAILHKKTYDSWIFMIKFNMLKAFR